MEIYQDTTRVCNKDSYKVFKELYSILEQRMEYGLLTIIDHSNLLEMKVFDNYPFKLFYFAFLGKIKKKLEITIFQLINLHF